MLVTIHYHIYTRTDAESGHADAELDCYLNEIVELEKSNVLLIGPTGSGVMCNILVLYLKNSLHFFFPFSISYARCLF